MPTAAQNAANAPDRFDMVVDRLTDTAEPADDYVSDRELLRQFRDGREAAFAALLQRHGAMVLRVCRRVLDNPEDAEDAFQATFLVLVRKAASVEWHESIGTWLHAAAHRLAREARRTAVRRHAREARRAPTVEGDALDEVSSRELLAILDEELTALPEESRGPLILCCLEGMTGDEAARHLGCSESTLKRRLQHGRELLQARLSRRGVALPAAAFLTILAAGAAAATLPPDLATATTRAATATLAGKLPAPGLVSERALSLARHMVPAAAVKMKLVIGLLVVGSLVAVPTIGGRELVGLGGAGGRAGQGNGPPAVAASPAVPKRTMRPGEPVRRVPGVGVTVETTLRTRGPWIRQFAFDGNPRSFFASADDIAATDHFTLVFDRPVMVTSVEATTGTPNEFEGLGSGRLEVSTDGTKFEPIGTFVRGSASGNAKGALVRAVRINPGAQTHRLLVREVKIEADPPLAGFRHPVEFAVDTTGAPELADWAERAARLCERAYPAICDELASDGFRPPYRIPLIVRRDAGVVASASGGQVIASAGYFEANPHDVGALVYATSLLVQASNAKGTPGWLVNGVADYIRFFKFEAPGALVPPDPDTARHDGDSQQTASFLAYLVTTYDPALVRRLNAALRDGRYTEEIWVELTGKVLRELDAEWRRALRR